MPREEASFETFRWVLANHEGRPPEEPAVYDDEWIAECDYCDGLDAGDRDTIDCDHTNSLDHADMGLNNTDNTAAEDQIR